MIMETMAPITVEAAKKEIEEKYLRYELETAYLINQSCIRMWAYRGQISREDAKALRKHNYSTAEELDTE